MSGDTAIPVSTANWQVNGTGPRSELGATLQMVQIFTSDVFHDFGRLRQDSNLRPTG